MRVPQTIARTAFLTALLASAAFPQNVVSNNVPADGLEIRGTVVQPTSTPGGTVPLGGVQVTLTEFRLIENVVTPTIFGMVSTDGQGMFRFRPPRMGEFIIDIKLDGYVAAGQVLGQDYSSTSSYPSLSGEKPIWEGRFALMRTGGLSGRVLDEAGNPIPELPLRIYARTGGVRMMNSVTTQADGTFLVANLQPAQYAVGTLPKGGGPAIVTPFTEKDIDVVDSNFDLVFWPGVPDLESATLWTTSPGASTNLPDLHLRKVPTYRAYLSVKPTVKQEDCAETDQWTLHVVRMEPSSLRNTGPPDSIPTRVPCGNDLLVRNLRPGRYVFNLWSGTRDVVNTRALQQVEVKDKNITVALEMLRGADLTGRVIPAEGARLPSMNMVMVSAYQVISDFSLGSYGQAPDGAGRFAFNNIPWGRIQLSAYVNDRARYYVQAIRLNGQALPDGVANLSAGGTGALEVVIDDKPASVTATIMDGDKPFGQGWMALVKWPIAPGSPEANSAFGGRILWSGSERGNSSQIQATGLAPGEYRAFAVRREDQQKLQDPAILERVAGRGEKIVLERGGSQNITLKLSDPSR